MNTVPDEEEPQTPVIQRREPVYVYLYDLSMGLARQFSMQFVGRQFEGIWHTGVVVYGREYFFGGGIFDAPPGQTPYGTPVQKIEIGYSDIPREIFHEMLEGIRPRYNMMTYNLLNNNCNNFSNEVTMFLTGKPIPSFITSLPEDFMNTPMGQMFRPFVESMQNRMLSSLQTQQPTPEFSSMLGNTFNNLSLGQGSGGPSPFLSSPASMALPGATSPSSPLATPAPDTKQHVDSSVGVAAGHRHKGVVLSHLHHHQPILLSAGAENTPTITAKLRQFIAETGIGLSDDEDKLLAYLQDMLKNNKDRLTQVSSLQNGEAVFALLNRLVDSLPAAKLFPALDLLRLLVLVPAANTYYATKQIQKIIHLFSTYIIHKEKDIQTSKGVTTMLLRLGSNMFGLEAGALALISPENRHITADVISEGVLSSDSSCRLAGSTLAYNCSLFIGKADPDFATQLLSALVHALSQPTRSGDECDYIMLTALGHLLYCNDVGCELVEVLGLDLNPFLSSSNSKISGVAQEVKQLL